MKHNRNPLATAIHYALGAGALAGLALTAAPVAAQDDDEEAVLERVQVTGTRLSRIDFEGASPVTIVTRADIERIGLNDIGEVLRQLPAVTGSPVGTNTNNGNTGGVSLTNLRGMGTVRTLVLINGRRAQTTDLSAIPVAAIERIEVLKEGASAIYGADAVAGVVNFITRRDFQGAQLVAHFGQSLELDRNPTADELNNPALKGSDGDVGRLSLTIGDVGPRGSFIIGAERTKQDPVYQGNIDQVQFRQEVVFGTAAFLAAGGYPACLNTTPVVCPPTGGSSSNLQGFYNVPGVGFFSTDLDTRAIRPFNADTDLYNYAPINFIQQPFTRTSIFGQGEFDLFENVNGYIETRWTNRRSEAELAPLPLFVGLFDPPFSGVPAENAFNPFGVTIPDLRRRVAESRRRFVQDVVRTDITVGLRGDFAGFAPTWSWDMAYSWNKTGWHTNNLGQFVGATFETAVGPSFFDAAGNAVCGTPDAPILDVNGIPCVPMNLFGGFGTITQAMLDFVEYDVIEYFTTTQQGFGAAAQGDLFQLPAGPLGLAVGYEWRDQYLLSLPESGQATNSVTGNTFSKTEGEYDVNSWFAEVNVPLIANVPGAEMLEVGAGVRIDDYSTIGDNTSVMFSARWKPFADLLIRGSYSDVFKEPTIGQLFSPQGDSYPAFQDPCSTDVVGGGANLYAALTPEQQARCHAQGVPVGGFFQTNAQPRARVGGNPDLNPESGETVTVGFAYAPSMVPGLTMTVDYWDISLDDPIQGVGAATVMDQCIVQGNLQFCDSIFRQGPAGAVPGEVERIISLVRNTGKMTAKGWDFEVAYNRNTAMGLWNFRTLWTYLDERKSQVLPGGVNPNVAGRTTASGDFGLNEAVWPEWKGLTTVDWTMGNFGASASWEFIDSVTETAVAGAANFGNPDLDHKIPRVNYFDFTGRYTLPWGTRLTAGLTNAFNTQPPFIIRAFNARTDTDTYRMLGRSYFINLTHDF